MRHGRSADARKSLARLTSQGTSGFSVDDSIAMMMHTNEVEKRLDTEGISYLDCFRGTNLRRTEIACMVWVAQQFSGSSLTAYAPYFYQQAGLKVKNSFNLSIGMYAMAIIGGIIAWFLMRYIGRRTIYIWGLSVLFIVLITGGIFGIFPQLKHQPWILGSLIILLTFVYDLTIGPVCYVLVAEIPSTRLRVKTVAIARVAYNLANFITNAVTTRMLNPIAWNWKGKSCFVYAGTVLVILMWCYWRLPESFGMSYLEIDILFERRAKTGKFREFKTRMQEGPLFSMLDFERMVGVWRSY
jgi:SP family general alpha glucoside:H+ symporter-like MFS transporter